MSDPQHHSVPPYISSTGQPGQPPYATGVPAIPPAGYPLGTHPAQPTYAASTAAPATNGPGRIGFVIGLISLAVGLFSSVIVQSMYLMGAWDTAPIINGLSLFLTFAGSVLALVFGLIALRRQGVAHGQAGIAVGLGIAGVAAALMSVLYSAFGWLLSL